MHIWALFQRSVWFHQTIFEAWGFIYKDFLPFIPSLYTQFTILQLRAQKELVHLLDNLDFKMYFLTEYWHWNILTWKYNEYVSKVEKEKIKLYLDLTSAESE